MNLLPPPELPVGALLMEEDGTRWTWLGDTLPDPLPVGRNWLARTPGPYMRLIGTDVVMPWHSDVRSQSAQRYGPFLLVNDNPQPEDIVERAPQHAGSTQRRDVVAGLHDIIFHARGIVAGTGVRAEQQGLHVTAMLDGRGRPVIEGALLAQAQAYAALIALGDVQ